MCGIVGVVDRDLARTIPAEELDRMVRTLVHRGPDDEGHVIAARRRRSACGAWPSSISSGGQQPFSNEDGDDSARRQRRNLQLRGHQAGARGPGPSVPEPQRHRSARARVRGVWRGISRAPARHVRAGVVGRAVAAPDRGARPRRGKAALLDADLARAVPRVRDQGAAGQGRGAARDRPRGARRVPDLRVRHRTADHLPAASTSCRRPTCCGIATAR